MDAFLCLFLDPGLFKQDFPCFNVWGQQLTEIQWYSAVAMYVGLTIFSLFMKFFQGHFFDPDKIAMTDVWCLS